MFIFIYKNKIKMIQIYILYDMTGRYEINELSINKKRSIWKNFMTPQEKSYDPLGGHDPQVENP